MPYLYGAAVESHKQGIPMMRAMMLEFPADPGCDYLDRQYMLGDALLVAPIFSPTGEVDYYLPKGRWTNFFTNQVIEGGRWQHEKHDYLSLPLMVRPNTILPVGVDWQRPDYEYADGVTFQLFELQDGGVIESHVPNLKGEVALKVVASRNGQVIDIQVQGATKPWSVLLRNIGMVKDVKGGVAQPDEFGIRLIPSDIAQHLKVYL